MMTSGSLSDNEAVIGGSAGSSGMVTVTGGTWTTTGGFTMVGQSGTGMLLINGGLVSGSSPFYIGESNTSAGTVTVSSGTLSDLSVIFRVGFGGTGTLNLTGSGVVTVGNNGAGTVGIGFQNASSGVLNIGTGGQAGTLNAVAVLGNGTAPTLNFNQSGTTTFLPKIQGTIAVNNLGTGDTILTGSNTYTGTTAINAGTLTLNGWITNSPAVFNEATFALGNSLIFSGSYSQATVGTLNLSITNTGTYTAISAAGPAALAGTLNVSGNAYGSSANPGDIFTLITGSSGLTGTFSTVNLPTLQTGLQWYVAYNSNSLVITVYAQQTYVSGTPFTFTAAPPGSGPFTYQWSLSGSAISSATNATYSADASTSGIYSVVSTNAAGSTTDYFGVTVTPGVAAILPRGLVALALLLCCAGGVGCSRGRVIFRGL